MSLAKLTSLSTQTLSLLLERQRLQSLSERTPSSTSSTLPQIIRNLDQLRTGILEFEHSNKTAGSSAAPVEALKLLRNQHERMRGMLGDDAERVASIEPLRQSGKEIDRTPSPSMSLKQDRDVFTPYTDDPPEHEHEPAAIMEQQRLLMEQQDVHLSALSSSVNRQHHISLQINDELESHVELLEELDGDLDRVGDRLGTARRTLDRVAKGARENGSALSIGLLILVLLILIIVFKT